MTAERVMLLDAIVAGDLDGIRASTQVRPPRNRGECGLQPRVGALQPRVLRPATPCTLAASTQIHP